jgi:uncharacterized Zn finger protein (UPF0148 family)
MDNINLKCPKCGSTKIGQYRMTTGSIWCNDCNYRVEQKELDDSFVIKEREKNND